jgi:flagellar hook assembly protein FlgD
MGPNPFINQLTIDFKIAVETHLTIRIFDSNGKQVNTLVANSFVPGLHQLVWNGNDYAGNEVKPGIYVVQLRSTNGSPVSFKIIKGR